VTRWMIRLRRPVSAVLAGAYLSGCGVILNGTRQNVMANATPEVAKVTTTPSTGEYQTPISLKLERKKSYSIKFERAGYSPATVEIQNRLQAGILILDIVFGLVPVIVDAATGAWYKLTPNSALVAMTRLALGDGPDTIWIGLARDAKTGEVSVTSSVTGVQVHVEEK
jgi:hypothetical protein